MNFLKNSITSLQGIKYFTSLSRLDCNQCTNLTSLDISGMKSINTVIAYGCTSVNSVRVDRCSNLEYLDVCGAAISGIYLNSCHNLRWLNNKDNPKWPNKDNLLWFNNKDNQLLSQSDNHKWPNNKCNHKSLMNHQSKAL